MRKIFTLIIIISIASLAVAQEIINDEYHARAPMVDKSSPISIVENGDAIFLDDMNGDNSVTGLEARGWVVLNEDGGGTQDPWNQGIPTVFTAYEGPDDGYTFTNFEGANGFLIDQWLISPEVTVEDGDTLAFWHRSPDGNAWDDSFYVKYSTTAGITPTDFDQNWGRFISSETGWAQWTGTFSHSGTIRFAIQYYIEDGGPTGTYSNYLGIDYIEVLSASGGPTIIPIAQAREDLDNDYIPDRLGETVTVQGVVVSPNYNTGNFNYVVWDGTAGITTISFGLPHPEYNVGDELMITGEIGQYNGLTQIEPPDSGSVSLISTGNPTPTYQVLTLQQFYADPEMYEGTLIAFASLDKVAGQTWPSAGSNANILMTDYTDTITMRIDKETDLDDNPEPTWPRDIVGFGGQFDGSTPPDGGYQILPRYYSELLPPGTVPVELLSFTANVGNGSVTLYWKTATEINNSGFEIERANQEKVWQKIGFVNGNNGTEIQEYVFTDNTVYNAGYYYYRLKQIDFDGSFEYSSEIEVDLTAPLTYQLDQNYPNPFNPATTIRFGIPEASVVKLTIFNILGQEVTTLLNEFTEAGVHNITFDANQINSGVYYYRLESNNFVQVKKMMLLK